MGRLHLGTILGTTISLDFSFIILIVFFVLSDIQRVGARYALLWAPVLLISILFHELAHAAMIGIFGFGPSAIILEGIGGVTINQRKAKAWQDLLISIAGPASSFLLAALVSRAFMMFPAAQRDPFLFAFLPFLARANVLWGIFNCFPVGPLDGAAALRNFLRLFLRDRIAFVISVWVSMLTGAALAIYGFVAQWIFLALLMLWYVYGSYSQWQFYRSYNRPED